ncbi:4'-phosphopantetheinyl transferase family protein [Pseudohongiella acticola]|jgi:enterobactin synthetase component D / holo-[acyl-carrier protein] synthase|uniref:4'-phosphopantetheinyl transferase family protein n=1 Tax=Pseudohongiella acticola TaxID=1524254 RepID=UPI0030EE8FFA
MISLIPSPFCIESDCRLVSCHFDKQLFRAEAVSDLGLVLPASLHKAVQKRKAEFIAGRYCAREALMQLGNNPANTVGIGANREPIWPQGLVGSITHTHDYAAAVVAYHDAVRAVGIDSETWIGRASAANVRQQVLTSHERNAGCQQSFESSSHYLTLVFSAKESLFKCLFPLVNRFFDFHAAIITPDVPGSHKNGAFEFELTEDLGAGFHRGYRGRGRYTFSTSCVHTAIILTR